MNLRETALNKIANEYGCRTFEVLTTANPDIALLMSKMTDLTLSVVFEELKNTLVPENIKLDSITDKYGVDWLFIEYACPKCGNEYSSMGHCSQCKIKKVKHKPEWVLICQNPQAISKEEFLEKFKGK